VSNGERSRVRRSRARVRQALRLLRLDGPPARSHTTHLSPRCHSVLAVLSRLPFVLPSPNMPSWATALVYPATVFYEATNLSEGRGTTRPFEIIGAPAVRAPLSHPVAFCFAGSSAVTISGRSCCCTGRRASVQLDVAAVAREFAQAQQAPSASTRWGCLGGLFSTFHVELLADLWPLECLSMPPLPFPSPSIPSAAMSHHAAYHFHLSRVQGSPCGPTSSARPSPSTAGASATAFSCTSTRSVHPRPPISLLWACACFVSSRAYILRSAVS